MTARSEQIFGRRTVLCDGAMGTALNARGIPIECCFDELNLSCPDLVRSVHAEYLQAGSEIIETNTFGANAFRLEKRGLQDRVAAINQAGVRLAREAVMQMAGRRTRAALVAGSIGPLGIPPETPGPIRLKNARAAFEEQMLALAVGGPGTGADLLILETMTSLDEAEQAILAARTVAPHLPLFAMVTISREGKCLDGSSPETAAAKLTAWSADAIGVNCSMGPASVLSAVESMARVTPLPLIAMPSAGLPQQMNGRAVYPCSPEDMAVFARSFVSAGVQFIGGCCGTTPLHIRAIGSAVHPSDGDVPRCSATSPQENFVGYL